MDAPQPLPGEVALDGVKDFLSTCCATTAAWPHESATVDYPTIEGRSWRLRLSAEGTRTDRRPVPATAAGKDAADAAARGTANELVLAFYDSTPVDSLELDGDRRLFDLLVAWDPDE